MRLCPTCKTPLNEKKLHGETVDRCPNCRGIYFDKGELGSIIHLIKIFQSVNLNEAEIPTVSDEETTRVLSCPADGNDMEKRQVGETTIDVCPVCQGIWLDGGEISALKMTENHIRDNLSLYIRLGE